MNIVKKFTFFGVLYSPRFGGLLLLIFAIAMAAATFIENDYGTETARALVYSATWFEILIILLGINFIGNIARYKLFSWQKAPVLLFHLAFIIIILGAGITKYRGYEGLMTINEGEVSNHMISIDSYIQIRANKDMFTHNFVSKPLLLSELGENKFKEDFEIDQKKLTIELEKYIPRATYITEEVENGEQLLHMVVANNQERKDFYVKKGTRETIYGVPISFENPKPLVGDIIVKKVENKWMASFPEDTNYFNMIQNKASFYPKDSLVPLQFKALSQIKSNSMVFNEIKENSIRKLVSGTNISNKKNAESAMVLRVNSGAVSKIITLLGGKGYVNPFSSIFVDGFHLDLRYGSKPIELPFSLYLEDFILERYPGSDSPSAFYSKIEVVEKNDFFNYTIFMNNVLNHKGYRFFQSAYTPDEQGTILSVNHDYWGTWVTYVGYGLLGLGMILSLFWRNSHFIFLLDHLKR